MIDTLKRLDKDDHDWHCLFKQKIINSVAAQRDED